MPGAQLGTKQVKEICSPRGPAAGTGPRCRMGPLPMPRSREAAAVLHLCARHPMGSPNGTAPELAGERVPLSPRLDWKRPALQRGPGGPAAPSPSAGTGGLPGPRRRVTSVGDLAKRHSAGHRERRGAGSHRGWDWSQSPQLGHSRVGAGSSPPGWVTAGWELVPVPPVGSRWGGGWS